MELSNIMSTSHIESLMLNRATVDGWTILDKDGKKHRVIGIGNQKNCNGDELWSNDYAEGIIKKILNKHNIKNFKLENIKNNFVNFTELLVDENEYEILISKIRKSYRR